MRNPYFVLLCVALTGLYYIITGIQYWATIYFEDYLQEDKTVVNVSYALISVTGPILGVIIGGNITTYFGGYQSEKAMRASCVMALLCFCCSAPICFFTTFPPVAVLLWFLLFFGGGILPAMTGCMLSCVDQSQKTTANSIANLCYNLGGFMPGPFIYGILADNFG